MENLFNRYRNFTILILVLFAQLVLLAYQVKNNKDVPFLRFWTVTAVTPIATVIEDVRSGVAGFFGNYFTLRDVRSENKRMRDEMGRLKLENQFLKTELATAERAKALAAFAAQSPSKMLAARIIGTGTGANNKVVFVDRGSNSGVQKGMGVVTPDGIVGKVLAAYPTASQVLLVTDPGFGAGVISQKNHVRGVLKGLNYGRCRVDYVENEQKVDMGEVFYTSGDDRVFPKGMPVGKVTAVHDGSTGQGDLCVADRPRRQPRGRAHHPGRREPGHSRTSGSRQGHLPGRRSESRMRRRTPAPWARWRPPPTR